MKKLFTAAVVVILVPALGSCIKIGDTDKKCDPGDTCTIN